MLPISMAKMVYTSIYEYIRAYTMPYDIIPYPRLSIRYEPIWIISDHIGGIYHLYGFCRKHKRVYTRLGDITVYDGIWLFMTVYDGIWCSRKVYTSIYHHERCIWLFVDGISRYIPVYTCNLTHWFVSCCTRPAGPPGCWIFAAATVQSQDTLVQAQWCLLFWFSCRRPGTPSLGRGGGLGRGCCGRVCCPPCTAAAHAGSSILLPSLWCYNDVVAPTDSPSIQSRIHNCGDCTTAYVNLQTKHGFANQQTSKLTTWKYILIWPKNTVNKFSNFWLKNSTLCY